jgi:hypothetical protein
VGLTPRCGLRPTLLGLLVHPLSSSPGMTLVSSRCLGPGPVDTRRVPPGLDPIDSQISPSLERSHDNLPTPLYRIDFLSTNENSERVRDGRRTGVGWRRASIHRGESPFRHPKIAARAPVDDPSGAQTAVDDPAGPGPSAGGPWPAPGAPPAQAGPQPRAGEFPRTAVGPTETDEALAVGCRGGRRHGRGFDGCLGLRITHGPCRPRLLPCCDETIGIIWI